MLITPSRTPAEKVACVVAVRMPEDGPARASMQGARRRDRHRARCRKGSISPTTARPSTSWWTTTRWRRACAAPARCSSAHGRAQVAGDYAIGLEPRAADGAAPRVCVAGSPRPTSCKQITVQRVTKTGLTRIGPAVVTLARAEGLNAHAESVATRLRKAGDRR